MKSTERARRRLIRATLCASAMAGFFFLLQSPAAAGEAGDAGDAPPVPPEPVAENGPQLPENPGKLLAKAGQLIPEPVTGAITNENGDIGVGDARPSTPEPSPGGTPNPPPSRTDAGVIPRVGVGYNPKTATLRWSYDVKPPVDTNAITDSIPAPHVPVKRVLPGDFGVVQNHASHLVEDNRTADGPRYPTDPNNPDWNLTTTDAIVPGAGRVLRFDMVCPNHSGWNGHAGHSGSHENDGVYTGASKYDGSKGHLVFSYQWGDNLVNNEFIEAHYLAYGLSNDS